MLFLDHFKNKKSIQEGVDGKIKTDEFLEKFDKKILTEEEKKLFFY